MQNLTKAKDEKEKELLDEINKIKQNLSIFDSFFREGIKNIHTELDKVQYSVQKIQRQNDKA